MRLSGDTNTDKNADSKGAQPDIDWVYLGRGVYRIVFVCHDTGHRLVNGSDYSGPWVRKQKAEILSGYAVGVPDYEIDMHKPARLARVINLIEPDLSPGEYQGDLVLAYIEGEASTHDQVSCKLIEIYRRSRFIILDPLSGKNFVTSKDGKVRCLDYGNAKHRAEDVSLRCWEVEKHRWFDEWRKAGYEDVKPYCVVEGLNYLEEHLEEKQIKDKHITLDIVLTVNEFRKNDIAITESVLDQMASLSNKQVLKEFVNEFVAVGNKKFKFTKEALNILLSSEKLFSLNRLGQAVKILKDNKARLLNNDALYKSFLYLYQHLLAKIVNELQKGSRCNRERIYEALTVADNHVSMFSAITNANKKYEDKCDAVMACWQNSLSASAKTPLKSDWRLYASIAVAALGAVVGGVVLGLLTGGAGTVFGSMFGFYVCGGSALVTGVSSACGFFKSRGSDARVSAVKRAALSALEP